MTLQKLCRQYSPITSFMRKKNVASSTHSSYDKICREQDQETLLGFMFTKNKKIKIYYGGPFFNGCDIYIYIYICIKWNILNKNWELYLQDYLGHFR